MNYNCEQFGHFLELLENSKEYLTIHFSPSASARQERWRNYGLSADFLGDYFANFFPGNQLSDRELSQRDAVKAAVSFVANELLENAIKYGQEIDQKPIILSLYLYENSIVFRSVNYASVAAVDRFRDFIQRLSSADDLDSLFAAQLEKTAAGSGDSSMGILTMICDYGIELGWEFRAFETAKGVTQIDSRACLKLQNFERELLA